MVTDSLAVLKREAVSMASIFWALYRRTFPGDHQSWQGHQRFTVIRR